MLRLSSQLNFTVATSGDLLASTAAHQSEPGPDRFLEAADLGLIKGSAATGPKLIYYQVALPAR